MDGLPRIRMEPTSSAWARGGWWAGLAVGLAVGCALARWGAAPNLVWAESTTAVPPSPGRLMAFTSPSVNAGEQILYVIDGAEQVVSIYQFDQRRAKLKLAAVRHYAADHRLAEFNNEPPNVADIEKLVQQR